MAQRNKPTQSTTPATLFDPRLYQIASLTTLLFYGLVWLHFDVTVWQIVVTIGTALLSQYIGTRLAKLPSFDPKSALISYLGSNQQLKIIGHYFAGESNPTQYENLGVARAHRLKDSLFSTIPDDRCQFIGQLVSDRDGVRENLFRASEYGYAIYTETVKEIGNKAIVNFPYNSTKRINNPEVEQYLRDLAERLKKTTEKVAVTGHTGNLGADAPNMTLGMRRSEVVRDYLVSLGVESSRISIKSEGEKSPMVANTSENNRKQNSRAEIEIIQ